MAKDERVLREQAKMLIEKAEKIEQAKAEKIGRLVLKHLDTSWKDFNVETFKKESEKIWR